MQTIDIWNLVTVYQKRGNRETSYNITSAITLSNQLLKATLEVRHIDYKSTWKSIRHLALP